MGASEAEVVRTLVRGRLQGRLSVADVGEIGPVRHATVEAGPLVLVRDSDPLARGLRTAPQVRLSVPDVPPLAGAPDSGEARLSGRLHCLGAGEARTAALAFATANPVADLFDVGQGVSMYRLDLDGASLHRANGSSQVRLAEFATAEPDPLHEVERDLLVDLSDHHSAEIECFFRHALAAAGVVRQAVPRPVRLNRYGFVVDVGMPSAGETGGRWARLEFARAVRDRHDLAQLLHPVLFHHHRDQPCPRRDCAR